MVTIGDYYELIEDAKKTAKQVEALMQDFPKSSPNYAILQHARDYIKSYVELIKQIDVNR